MYFSFARVVLNLPITLTTVHNCQVKSKFSAPVIVQENKTMETTEENVDQLPIYDLDPKLAELKDHFSYRMKRYLDQKCLIEKHEGSLEDFSKG